MPANLIRHSFESRLPPLVVRLARRYCHMADSNKPKDPGIPSDRKLAKARAIVGSWLGTQRGKPKGYKPKMPDEVKRAYETIGQWLGRSMPEEVKSAGGKKAAESAVIRAKRAQSASAKSAQTRLATLPKEAVPADKATLRVRFLQNHSTGRKWTIVMLDAEGFRYRVSRETPQRRTLSPLGAWGRISPAAFTRLPGYVQMFLRHMGASESDEANEPS